jgi:hypothetical protein
MKKTLTILSITLMLLIAAHVSHALTLADINLLTTLGLLSEDQAAQAMQAINASGANDSTSIIVQPDEFSDLECLVLKTNMTMGDSGTAVGALQQFLQKQKHYGATTASGIYDKTTFDAVGDFQIAQGLITSRATPGAGNVGPLTREKIQEISCAPDQATAEIVELPTDVDGTVLPEEVITFIRRPNTPGVSRSESTEGYQATFNPQLLETHTKDGSYLYKLEMSIIPNDDIKSWRITLSCDEGQIVTNKVDFQCGDAIVLRAATDGSKGFRVLFTNTTRLPQEFGLVAVALDSKEQELARSSYLQELQPMIPEEVARTASGQAIIIGKVEIPENRRCTLSEQKEYLEYIMTRANTTKGAVIVPPPCYPGDVMCTYDFPSSFCEITGTSVNSVTICGGQQFFYDGKCRPFEEARNL